VTRVYPKGDLGDTSSARNKERERALCWGFPAFREVLVNGEVPSLSGAHLDRALDLPSILHPRPSQEI